MSNSRQTTGKQAASKQPSQAPQPPQEQQDRALPTEIAVRAYPVSGGGSVLAGLTFDINGCFAVRGAKLIQGKNGPFVSMPQRQTRDGYQEVVFPITREMRETINGMALDAYQQALADMQDKLEQTQKPAQPAETPAREMTMG